jgi:SAM-dependent methyltransferase
MKATGRSTAGEGDNMTTHRYHFVYGEQSAYAEVATLIREYFGRGEIILDVGCGFGAVAEVCREIGYVYVGLDADPAGLKDLADRGFEVHEIVATPTPEFRDHLARVIADRSVAGLLMLDVLEHLVDAGEVLSVLRMVASSDDVAPLILCVPNVTHFDIGAKLLQGRWDQTEVGILDDTHVGFYSEALLTAVAQRAGWSEIAKSDFKLENSDQHFPADNVALVPGTPLNSVLRQIRAQSCGGSDVCQFVRAYVPGPIRSEDSRQPDPSGEPFLSVLTRTQGTRIDTLQETILCMSAQTCQDFEVLLLAHNVTPEQAENLRYLVDSMSPAVSWKFRIISVTGPGRCRPLNIGVKAARGRYVAVLDDDDLVTGNWVETFRDLASQWPGRVLRAGVAEQDIARGPWPDRPGYNVMSGISTPYPSCFDLFDHLVENHSPPCGLAFPRSCFRDFGIAFDESLPVLEDWDVLLQATILCGVASSEEVTSIYRRWRVGPSSTSMHTSSEWDGAHQAVIAKLDRFASIFAPGSISRVRELQHDLADSLQLRHIMAQQEERLRQADAALREEVEKARADFISSRSWRITRPIRVLSRLGRRLNGVRPRDAQP